MKSITSAPWFVARPQRTWTALAMFAALAAPAIATPAYAAGLVIDPTFGSTITSLPDATAIEAAINAAVGVLEADITTPITVAIDFQNMTSGLGESNSGIYVPTYYQYYNALGAIDNAPGATAAQQSAFASLGTAPTGPSSGNPVNGSAGVWITAPEGRALGFNTPGVIAVGSGTYDTEISLNTSITSPPNGLSGLYGLEAVATHEMDEALGIGGTGSTIGQGTDDVGTLDLFRYTALGVRSWTTNALSQPYLSVDGGNTVVSYFNQIAGADYADWESDPIPAGFGPQVQDAFGEPGTDPALGPNEIEALNVIGYGLTSQETVPEPMSLAIMLPGVLGLIGLRRRARKAKTG